MVKINRWN